MNLWDLVRDWAQLLRLQFRPAHTYRYGLGVFIFVALGIGVISAANSLPILGNGAGVFWFAAVVAIGRWLLLTRVMTNTLHRFGSEKIPFLGYTLATESMMIPNILLLYFKELSPILALWNIWTVYVQALGFYRIGQLTSLKPLIIGYLLYFLASLVFIITMLILFSAANWVDPNSIQAAIDEAMRQKP